MRGSAFRKSQKRRYEKRKPCLEHREREKINCVLHYENAKFPVCECFQKRAKHRALWIFTLTIILFVYRECWNQHANRGHSAENRERRLYRRNSLHSRRYERAPNHRGGVAQCDSDNVSERNACRDFQFFFLSVREFRQKRSVGRAVAGDEKIIQKNENKKPRRIHSAQMRNWRKENQKRRKPQRNCGSPQKWNAPSSARAAVVRPVSYERICNRVENSSCRCYETDYRKRAEKNAPLRNEDFHSFRQSRCIRLIEIHEPRSDDSRKRGPSELPYGVTPHLCA